jgi:dTDP-glucose 4,6-dehydratase
MTIIITGGAGFIGSHVVRLFVNKYPEYRIVNLDALTYAGNLENLRDIEDNPNYIFEKVNLLDAAELDRVFDQYNPEGVIHLAAESHVDRSIVSPLDFVYTTLWAKQAFLPKPHLTILIRLTLHPRRHPIILCGPTAKHTTCRW